jgi:hypothetical protein
MNTANLIRLGVRDGNADYSGRMVVIGTDLKEDELAKLFHVQ